MSLREKELAGLIARLGRESRMSTTPLLSKSLEHLEVAQMYLKKHRKLFGDSAEKEVQRELANDLGTVVEAQ